jgi:hypothetical protein
MKILNNDGGTSANSCGFGVGAGTYGVGAGAYGYGAGAYGALIFKSIPNL